MLDDRKAYDFGIEKKKKNDSWTMKIYFWFIIAYGIVRNILFNIIILVNVSST